MWCKPPTCIEKCFKFSLHLLFQQQRFPNDISIKEKCSLFQHMKVCLNWRQLYLHDVRKTFFFFSNLFHKYCKNRFYYFLFVVAACQIEDTIIYGRGRMYLLLFESKNCCMKYFLIFFLHCLITKKQIFCKWIKHI